MQYVITDGKLYLSSKSGIHTVNNIKEASQYDLNKAINVIKSIPKTLKLSEWYYIEYNEDDINKPNNTSKKYNINEFNGLTDNILEKMLDIETYVTQLNKYLSVVEHELLKIKDEIIDIEHAAEFFNLNAAQGFKLYKMLQDARQRRRKLKDERAKIEYILNSNFVDCTKSAITDYIKGMDDRQYNPRVLKELFNI